MKSTGTSSLSTVHCYDNAANIVLYYLMDDSWKIADFGLTKAGTSNALKPTPSAHGTEGYRAPELLRDDPGYNNKVDIFAIGYILYELISGKRAFNTDFDVWDLDLEKSLPVDVSLPDISKDTISNMVRQTLCKDSAARPSAKDISKIIDKFLGYSSSGSISSRGQSSPLPQTEHSGTADFR
jgi:serine/threonine protein kinase